MKRRWCLVGFILIVGLTASLAVFGSETGPKTGIELTVYNENLALVKEQRQLDFPAGTGVIRFSDVTEQIDPATVTLTVPGLAGVKLLEQNYEYDLVNESRLLEKYLGEKITLTDTDGKQISGYLMGSGSSIILSTQADGGEVRVIKASQIKSIVFSQLPGGLVVKPTLTWLVQNPSAAVKQWANVSYLTGGLSWEADYVATINETDDRIDLNGWVTLNNRSGAEFADARLKLVAGEVNRVTENQEAVTAVKYEQLRAKMMDNSFEEQSFFEYHLYTLGRPTTLKNNQMKQVELLTTSAVPAVKRFIYQGATDNKVRVYLELKNSAENGLGMPLPKGKIRVQKADAEGSLQFVGEDRLDHIAKDEQVRVLLGNAFDIVGERVQTEVKKPSKNTREETYRITLRNHKTEAVTITVLENISGWYESDIIKTTHDYVKTAVGKVEFQVKLPADEEVVLEYTVKYKTN